jgi:hypothetical protein
MDDLDGGELGPVTAEWCELSAPIPEQLRGHIIATRLSASRTWTPADQNPASSDRRRLSVMVAEIRAE